MKGSENLSPDEMDYEHAKAERNLPLDCEKKVECPECLKTVTQGELDMFNGFCENCQEVEE